MPCPRFDSLLSPYLDGELAVDEASQVREHVAICEACRAVVASHQLVRGRLVGAQFPALAPEVVHTLFERARSPRAGWGQLAAAVIFAALVPAAIAFSAPRVRTPPVSATDTVSPDLDLGL